MSKDFKFSVVMPVYNVEEYLEESILSIVKQSIGFDKNVQLILVNDGSEDGSGKICQKYAERYPENVVYVEQENSGVSAARNHGMEFIKGKYVNFLDSDDIWSKDAFSLAYNFFEKHYDEVDVVATSIHLFEAVTRNHILNYRLDDGTRVADLSKAEESNNIVVQVASSFFKAEAIRNEKFIVGLRLGEDSIFVNSVIMEKLKVGFVDKAKYYYRKREVGTSAVQTLNGSKYYYFDRIVDFHLVLIEKCIEKFGRVVPYIQNVVYYDFAWSLSEKLYEFLDQEELDRFKELSRKILSHIDDEVILQNQVHTPFYRKITALKLKYNNDDILSEFVYDRESKSLLFHNITAVSFQRNKYTCYISFVDIKNGVLKIEGLIANWVFEATDKKVKIAFRVNGEIFKVKIKPFVHLKYAICFDEKEKFSRFSLSAKLPDFSAELKEIKVFPIIYFGKRSCRLGMNYQKFVPNTNSFSEAYKFYGDYCVRCFRTVIKISKPETRLKKLQLMQSLEFKCQKELIRLKKGHIAALRRRYYNYKLFNRGAEKIWLLSDRVENGGDNGEVLFKYLSKIKREGKGLQNVRPIFAISKNAACVERIKSEGEVVFFEDRNYELYFLLADKIISSGASDFTMNPFGLDRKYLIDLFNYKYYYLQHGVACADLSGWLNRYAKNLKMIFASSERERDGFLNSPYYYSKNNVVVTGQTRFDDLYDDSEKMILILPTWRRAIKESYDSNTTSVYFDGFKDTEYFKYYNGLINNERLLNHMREKGYKGLFCIHPIHMKQSVDFEANDVFSVNDGYVDYNEVFAHSSLMVTDYSSVLFDFAYLRKPVVYTQFDKKEFFEYQIYDEGYFSYENDGFGPVCYDMESTVDAIIAAIDRDCKNEPKYLERLDAFFAYNDKKNCERAYKAIIGEKFEISDYNKK